MTTLEMLDALERRIAGLRAERARLLSALGDAEQRLKTISELLHPAAECPKPLKRSRKAAAPAPETETKLGKRRALGRGLADLRRTSAPVRPGS